MEMEPNDDAKSAQRLTFPFTASGVISKSGDQDRYVFSAKKGESLALRVHAALVHSPLDASLRIEDTSGKVLQQDDDADDADPDPEIAFKVPADGDYIAIVNDLFHRGGAEFCYALEATAPSPQVNATLSASAVKIDAGKTAELKATVKIKGKLNGKLVARGMRLPTGVTMKETEIPEKGGEVKLTFSADAAAAAAAVPVEIVLTSSAPDEPITFKAGYDLRGTEPRGDRLINEDSRVWLTVTPSPVKPQPAAAAIPSGSATPPTAAPAAK
jgi:hypothetical protein